MLSRETLATIQKRLADAMGEPIEEVKFTSLQLDAFNCEGFWLSQPGSERHMIIQGATSSGKTLVSEVAIIDSLKNGNHKCIVLVPLRAMVRERYEKLRADLKELGIYDSVYPSSSDYQENDGEIIQGNYSVAVIVYEKFFAMLSQSQAKGNNIPMLNGCSLLVVDELQMLNSRDRGPKLEIAIQKVLKRNSLVTDDKSTRIMCLTTCDCKVELIERWLTVNDGTKRGLKPIVIRNEKRPAGLLEYVMTINGKFKSCRTYGERENMAVEPEEGQGYLEGFTAIKGKERDRKKALLKALLVKIYAENSNAKVLVFVNGRHSTRSLAQFLAGENLLPVEEMSERMKRIADFDEDEYSGALKSLLTRRIAFHNASLSAPLRGFIESLFCDTKHPLKLILATETLTIGMNMPVDVMILYDSQVRRPEGYEPLTTQEYKNFVGRAGRLGQKNRGYGESYIFAADERKLNVYWNDYVHYRPEEIQSALARVGEEGQAPYYVNLLRLFGQNGFTAEDLKELWQESFAKKCTGKELDTQKICRALVEAKLCVAQDNNPEDEEDEDDESDTGKRYFLTDFGIRISPYALSLYTCRIIRRFCKWGYKKPVKGGLPTNTTADELDKYLLDILYRICLAEEVERIGQLRLPNQGEGDKDIYPHVRANVRKTLRKIIDSGECKLWPNSQIEKILSPNYLGLRDYDETGWLLRAIVLWYWTKGYDLKGIRQETNFSYKSFTPIIQEDIARIAETVAYILEAVSACFEGTDKFEHLKVSDLYAFSTCVNYGMPRELVVIANKHVSELDRKKILALGALWNENRHRYNSPVQMLTDTEEQDLDKIRKILTESERDEIIRKIEESGFHDDYEILLTNMNREGKLNDSEDTAIRALCKSDPKENPQKLLEPLKVFFKTEDTSAHFFADSVNLEYPLSFMENENLAELSCRGKTFLLAAYNNNPNSDDRHFVNYIEKKRKGNSSIRVILFGDDGILQRINWEGDYGELLDESGNRLLDRINAAMTLKQFAFLLSQTIKNNDTAAQMLSGLLQDVTGKFQCSLNTLGMMLKNFSESKAKDYSEGSADLPMLNILLDQRKSAATNDLTDQLKRAKISYRLLSWGDKLDEENVGGKTYLLFLDWNVVQEMHSLKLFYAKLRRTHFKKTFAIFNSPESFKAWDGGNVNFPHYCESTKEFSKVVPERIKPLLCSDATDKFLIGVSYAHDSPGKDLLKKFVDSLLEEFAEDKIFFDEYDTTQNLLHGKGAGEESLQYYKECQFFLVLDTEHYDLSEPCRREFRAIEERIKELGENRGHRLWFLHPSKVEHHCRCFDERKDYLTELNEEKVEEFAARFVCHVVQNCR